MQRRDGEHLRPAPGVEVSGGLRGQEGGADAGQVHPRPGLREPEGPAVQHQRGELRPDRDGGAAGGCRGVLLSGQQQAGGPGHRQAHNSR